MNLQGFSLRHLAVLDMLLTEQHVGRAAERMRLSQPAISNTLAWLRAYFGDPLLVRSGGTLRLTPFATRLREPVRRLLLDFRSVAASRPVFEPATATHRFRIVMSHYICTLLLSHLLTHFAQVAPHATLEALPIDGDVNEFGRGEVDLVIVPRERMFPHRTFDPLFVDRWVCVGWAAAWDADHGIDMDCFRAARHVLPDQPQSILPDHGVALAERDTAAVVPYALLLRTLVGTPWLATVPERFVVTSPWRGELRMFEPPFATRPLEIVQQWHPEAHGDASIRWLRGMVREALAKAGLPILAISLERNEVHQNF